MLTDRMPFDKMTKSLPFNMFCCLNIPPCNVIKKFESALAYFVTTVILGCKMFIKLTTGFNILIKDKRACTIKMITDVINSVS